MASPTRVRCDAGSILATRTGAPRELFRCGSLIESHARDNHRESLLRFSVKRRSDLVDIVIPFFEQHPLLTAKRQDFERFAFILQLMQRGAHLEHEGLRSIAEITEVMNRRQRSRYLESSEAIRQPASPPTVS